MAKRQLTPEQREHKRKWQNTPEQRERKRKWHSNPEQKERRRELDRERRAAAASEGRAPQKRTPEQRERKNVRARAKAAREGWPSKPRTPEQKEHRRLQESARLARLRSEGRLKKRQLTPEQRIAKIEYDRQKYRSTDWATIAIYNAKLRARRLGIDFDGLEFLRGTVPVKCGCCSIPFGTTREWKTRERSPTIDRLDNSKGYTAENARVICWRCNALKRDATVAEIRNLLAYMES
jgi:hypothetical protein